MNHGVFTLENGTTIVLDHRPQATDFAFGVAFRVGSRDEAPHEHGFSHAHEHIVFRGSAKYPSSVALSRPLDRLGAETNAYTEWESTAYHTCVPASGWETAVDLIVDMVQNALYRDTDLKLERGAILEEWANNEDNPEDRVVTLMQELLYGDCSLGRNIEGNRKAIKSITSEGLRAFRDRHYVPDDTVVVAVGQIPEGLYAELERRFGSRPRLPPLHEHDAVGKVAKRHRAVCRESLEQVSFGLGFPTCYGHGDRRYSAMAVLTTALTGYASSVLFQEVRDKRGLVYEIDSEASAYRGLGDFEILGGAAPNKLLRAINIIVRVMRDIKKNGLSADDFETARSRLVNCIALASNDSDVRLGALMSGFMTVRGVTNSTTQQQALLAVSNDDIIALANEMWRASEARFITVGPVTDIAPYLAVIERLGG